ncbi:MAG: hypothetical protein IPJ71_18105 [Bdellovibrionales bacterium]|nr:hypothetical protein [Bdellovibrionales bacterium]MBK7845561.1 hypothetical protein [Bdellovibrionales bacterium]
MRVSKTAMILLAAFPFIGISGLAGEHIPIISITPSPSQIQLGEKINTEVSIENSDEIFGDNNGYAIKVEGPSARKAYDMLKNVAAKKWYATVDVKTGKDVVCVHGVQKYGFRKTKERDTYTCWFKFETEVGSVESSE